MGIRKVYRRSRMTCNFDLKHRGRPEEEEEEEAVEEEKEDWQKINTRLHTKIKPLMYNKNQKYFNTKHPLEDSGPSLTPPATPTTP